MKKYPITGAKCFQGAYETWDKFRLTKLILVVFTVLMVYNANSQLYTSSPAVNSYTSTASGYSGCSSNGSTIRARVISFSGTLATIQVNMINGGYFGNNGSLYLRQNSPCGGSVWGVLAYSSTMKSVNITFSIANVLPGQSLVLVPTMFSTSGERRNTGTITITNKCPIKMQWYSQVNSSWANNLMNNSCKISSAGCVISCLAMLLASQEGNSTSAYTPATVNSYLNGHSGYIPSCTLSDWSIPANMDGSGGVVFQGSNSTSNNWSWLDGQLSLCRKVIVNVNSGSHWVLVTGRTGPSGIGSSYKVLDPANGSYSSKTLANFSNTFLKGRSYSGTWKTNMLYRTMEEMNESDSVGVDDYETIKVEGTDGWRIPKSGIEINNIDNDKTFKIYPNPVTGDKINIQMFSTQAGQVVFIFTDILGKVVSRTQLKTTIGMNTYQLSIEGLKSGIYFLRMDIENKATTQKLKIIK